jgi:nucleoid DNA-binding protein
MTKREIVLKISAMTGIKQVYVKEVVQKTFDIISQSLQNGERIELRNFGVFYLKKRKKRVGRNPKTGQVVPIPERHTVAFKPGLEMKKTIK